MSAARGSAALRIGEWRKLIETRLNNSLTLPGLGLEAISGRCTPLRETGRARDG